MDKKYPSQSPERMKLYRKKWSEQNPEKVKSARNAWRRDKRKALEVHRRYKYGITPDQTRELLQNQKNSCAICKKQFSIGKSGVLHFMVDHCHQYGYIRGLLCVSCNNGIGLFKDDPELLITASKYVENWKPI